jgi:hypothetical protein
VNQGGGKVASSSGPDAGLKDFDQLIKPHIDGWRDPNRHLLSRDSSEGRG